MKTLICHTCGCSLVRLGISKDETTLYNHEGKEYSFCCQPCVDLFITDPVKYLRETEDVIVCPTCLGEKPLERSATLNWAGQEIHFCHCPYCREEFQKDPDRYINRLEGTTPFESELRHN